MEEKNKFVSDNKRRTERLFKLLADEKENIVAIRAEIDSFEEAVELFGILKQKTKGNLYLLFIIDYDSPTKIHPKHVVTTIKQVNPQKNTFGIQHLPSSVRIHNRSFLEWMANYLSKDTSLKSVSPLNLNVD